MNFIGHRGTKGHAPENAIAAVNKALELGVQNIEVDVWLVDAKLVVFHDCLLERNIDGQGVLAEKTWTELQ